MKINRAIMIILIAFILLTMGMGTGAYSVKKITVTTEDIARAIPAWITGIGIIDHRFPISFNVHVSLASLRGCSESIPEMLDIPIGGTIHVYYNPGNGEWFARWEGLTDHYVYNPQTQTVVKVIK